VSELTIGARLEPYVVEAVDPEKMKIMAAILQDPNPIHYDVELVRSLGYGDGAINQGPINMAWFMNSAVAFAGGRERLLHTHMRFLGNVFGGERFVAEGTVSSIDRDAGTAVLEIECTANGRPVLAGTATVAIG
jgi:acyl dehydratase